MASFAGRVPQNVAGKFYVDSSCIYCGLCDGMAPTIFRECNDQGWAYVFKQPETPDELRLCLDALGACPTGSIGADGDAPAVLPFRRIWWSKSGVFLFSVILAGIVVNTALRTPNVVDGGVGTLFALLVLAVIFKVTIEFFLGRWMKWKDKKRRA